jgi:hypothetical protein
MSLGQLIMQVGQCIAALCDHYVARRRAAAAAGAAGAHAAGAAGGDDGRDAALQQDQRQGGLVETLRSSRCGAPGVAGGPRAGPRRA